MSGVIFEVIWLIPTHALDKCSNTVHKNSTAWLQNQAREERANKGGGKIRVGVSNIPVFLRIYIWIYLLFVRSMKYEV